jgi:hypothetical protein
LETSEIRSEIPGKFLNVVVEKDAEDQLVCSCDKLSITMSKGGEQYPTKNKKKKG